MKIINQISEARERIKQGQLIAYPTEAVYGLGCDAFNQQAVEKLLLLKQRAVSKGLIILIADWSQLEPLISAVPENALAKVQATWPGAVTWIFPKAATIPNWLSGGNNGIAIRMTSHSIARELCREAPLVSTSANISGHTPAIDLAGLYAQFPYGVDAFFDGPLGGNTKPSAIYDVISGACLR